jgi:hypothetical protein
MDNRVAIAPHGYRLHVHDKVKTLCTLAEAFCGDAHISLEGDLSKVKWDVPPDIPEAVRPVLRRNTLWPEQDFAIFPLEESTRDSVFHMLHAAGLKRRVWHVQIEKGGDLVFGAFDGFDEGVAWVSKTIGAKLLDDMVRAGVLKSYDSTT